MTCPNDIIQIILIGTAVTAFTADKPIPVPGLEPAPTPGAPIFPESSLRDEILRGIAANKDLPVPEPVTTPFDADPDARKVYMESYRSGYRIAVAGFMSTCCAVAGTPHRNAVVTGYYDGQLAAMKDHPKEVLGIEPVEMK